MKKIKSLWSIFITFFKIGAMAFGGGYAILPILEKELIEKRTWISKEQLADFFALSQCLPGVIASNVAVFIGYEREKKAGGITAAMGVVLPSFLIISIVATLLTEYSHLQSVQDAFVAIRACVCVLIIKAIVNLWKNSIVDAITLGIFLLVFVASLFIDITPIIYVIIVALFCVILTAVKGRKKK